MGKVVAASDSLDKEKTLQELWRHRFDWVRDAERTSAFVKRAVREGDFLMAYDAAREAVEEHRLEDVWLQQQMALALAQLGSTARAQAILKSLLELEPANRETLGLLGRTYKDEWHADRENTKARDSALEWYQRAFAIDPPDYYPGINAAALALLSDDRQLASHLATKVMKICQNNLQAPHPEELYWLRASLAEAFLILQQPEEAKKAYRQAAAIKNLSLRELCSTRKQARLLANHIYGRPELFDQCFSIPKLAIFSGHMMDSVNRSARRFAAADEPAIRSAIEKQLEQMNAGISFSSAACGSDIIFLEAMLGPRRKRSCDTPLAKGAIHQDERRDCGRRGLGHPIQQSDGSCRISSSTRRATDAWNRDWARLLQPCNGRFSSPLRALARFGDCAACSLGWATRRARWHRIICSLLAKAWFAANCYSAAFLRCLRVRSWKFGPKV